MLLLLRKNALPLLEQLYVTIEWTVFDLDLPARAPPAFRLPENDLRPMTDATCLRVLVVRHLSLDQVIVLLRCLELPVLHQLTLVDIFDDCK